MEASYQHISVERLSPTIGGVISGPDGAPINVAAIDAPTFAEIRQAFLDRGVIFFRDQQLTPESHVEFAARFGEPEVYPFKNGNINFSPHPSGLDTIVQLAKDENRPGVENAWHTDVAWMLEPSLGSVLYARELPDIGGDTLFSDCEAVYNHLDDHMKAWLETLEANYDWMHTFGSNLDPDALAEFRRQHPGSTHPVIRTHPDTGRKALYLSSIFLKNIVGVTTGEWKPLVAHLESLVARPEFQCRFRWQVDSVAVWDNRRVQHYAVNDYYPKRRVMDRVTIAGSKPY